MTRPVKFFPLSFLAILVCALMAPSQHSQAAIVAYSDDFENSPTNNNGGANGSWRAPFNASWTTGGSGDVLGTDQYSFSAGAYVPPHSGNITAAFWSATNDGSVSTASLSTDVPTTVGMTYDLRFWISNPVADISARQNLFSVSWNGALLNLASDPRFKLSTGGVELPGTANQFVVDPNTNWFEVFISNLAPGVGPTTNLTFSGQNNNWATLVDNVLVEETPEPSTLVMLCAGAALIGARRRRRHRSA